MIVDFFKISGTVGPLLDFNDPIRVHFGQVFHSKWDEVLLSITKVPGEDFSVN